jgi:hypothetical protein
VPTTFSGAVAGTTTTDVVKVYNVLTPGKVPSMLMFLGKASYTG